MGGALGLSAARTAEAAAIASAISSPASTMGRHGSLERVLPAYSCSEYGVRVTLISKRDYLSFAHAYEPNDIDLSLCSGNGEDWAEE